MVDILKVFGGIAVFGMLLSLVVVIIGLAARKWWPRLWRRALLAAGLCFAASVVVTIPAVIMEENAVTEAGFDDSKQMREAEKAGYSTRAEWDAAQAAAAAEAERVRVEAERAAAEKAAAEEAARVAAEAAKAAACRDDLQCWGDKHWPVATAHCTDIVERLGKINARWVDSWSEAKFPRWGWADKSAGVLRYRGDRIEYQNGFGAWIIHNYYCDYDPAAEKVVDAGAAPGRL